MTAGRRRRKHDPVPSTGDDEVPTPARVDQDPPHNRCCDLVLTGGVASGVVYPWAIVELARAYWFRNIGGTSVGAMAAALAAAAEYGRRNGIDAPFEVLRRAPAALGAPVSKGRTRMLSLFQTNAHGRRLIEIWGRLGDGGQQPAGGPPNKVAPDGSMRRAIRVACAVYARPLLLGALAGVVVAGVAVDVLWRWPREQAADDGFLAALAVCVVIAVLVLVAALLGAAVAGALAVWRDIRLGVIDNSYGLCKGGTTERPDDPAAPSGISEWLHDQIQRSAGLADDAPPLRFRDLWTAPLYPGAQRLPCGPLDPAARRSINLQMITTNVTHGRPYRLPLDDENSRLFFRPGELEGFFPPCVLAALVAAAGPYTPRNGPGSDPHPQEKTAQGLLELPVADLPVVVAARLSLSFPLLFSAVPLWAIDYEAPLGARTFRRCLFTDGGASSNFPIHLFDAAVPRWPTFGFWLDRHPPYKYGLGDDVWLPQALHEGRGDNWNRFDPASRAVDPDPPAPQESGAPFSSTRLPEHPAPDGSCKSQASMLFGFLSGLAVSATDWRDRTSFRMPHVRNRVARLLLRPGEGGLHIGMPRQQILQMAHRYGTQAGLAFVRRFADADGQPSQAWQTQRWARFNLLVNGLRERLDGLATSAAWPTNTVPLQQAIRTELRPMRPVDDPAVCAAQADGMTALLHALEELEQTLVNTPPAFSSPPQPELRLRPPL